MFKFTEVPEGLLLTLTDGAKLLKEFPNLDVGLYEAMDYCDFAPEGTNAADWDEISGFIGHAAIGYMIYDNGGGFDYSPNVPYRMFENQNISKDDILPELVKNGQILFTECWFKIQYGKNVV